MFRPLYERTRLQVTHGLLKGAIDVLWLSLARRPLTSHRRILHRVTPLFLESSARTDPYQESERVSHTPASGVTSSTNAPFNTVVGDQECDLLDLSAASPSLPGTVRTCGRKNQLGSCGCFPGILSTRTCLPSKGRWSSQFQGTGSWKTSWAQNVTGSFPS